MKEYYKNFKLKYNIATDWDAILIIIVFSITGSLSVKLARPILEWLGVTQDTMSPWFYWPLRILIIFPVYQILQIAVGTTLGQFNFFWQFQKKMFKPFGRLFGLTPTNKEVKVK